MIAELARIVGDDAVLPGSEARYLEDATAIRGLRGKADAVVLPGSPAETAQVVAFCYEHELAVIPRGGGTTPPSIGTAPPA